MADKKDTTPTLTPADELKAHGCPAEHLFVIDGQFNWDSSEGGRYWAQRLGEPASWDETMAQYFTFEHFVRLGPVYYRHEPIPGAPCEHNEQSISRISRRINYPVQFLNEPPRLPIGMRITHAGALEQRTGRIIR